MSKNTSETGTTQSTVDLSAFSTPGEILREEFMRPMGYSARGLAAALNTDLGDLVRVIYGHKPIDLDLAVKLGLHFKLSPQFWINLQRNYDERIERHRRAPAEAGRA